MELEGLGWLVSVMDMDEYVSRYAIIYMGSVVKAESN
jgi:hypothetical protein